MNRISSRFSAKNIIKGSYWVLILAMSFWIINIVFFLIYKRFINDSISIGVDSANLQWTNIYPAVSICLSKSRGINKILDFIRAENLSHHVGEKYYAKVIYDYIFTNPNNVYIKAEYCTGLNSTCGVNITDVRKRLLPNSCRDFIENITFKGITYDNCEDVFKFHELEMGYCFLANNLNDFKEVDKLPLTFTKSDTKRHLELILRKGLLWKYEIYVHSPEDLPYFNFPTYDLFSDSIIFNFNLEETLSDVAILNKDIKQRMCKFPEEKSPDSNYLYSFSSCVSKLRIDLELANCNCTLFTSPNKYFEKYCDMRGITCVRNANILSKVKQQLHANTICLPSCTEQQITLIGSAKISSQLRKDIYRTIIDITNLPFLRYLRVTSTSKLDVIVSSGGVIGLLIGTSLLNIVELIMNCILFFKAQTAIN